MQRSSWIIGAIVLASACSSQTKLPANVRNELQARHLKRTVELKQSVYFGDLYDENEKWLLSPHPFGETFHIVDLEGAPIHPQGQKGIIPAGSAFVIEKLEFPDSTALAMRMLTTPRYNPWIYLTPGPGNTAAPTGRRFFILLLPMDLETGEATQREIDELLAPAGEVQAWMKERSPEVRAAIERKDVVAGMTLPEVVASLGKPPRWFVEQPEGGEVRVAWYPSRELWMRDDVVKEVRTARLLDAPAPKQEPEPAAQPAAEPAAQPKPAPSGETQAAKGP